MSFPTTGPAQIGGGGPLIRGNGGVPQRGGPADVTASSQVALAAVMLKILGKTGTAGKTALAVLRALPPTTKANLRSVMQYVGVTKTAAAIANILKQPFSLVLTALTKIFFRKTKLKMN